MITDLHDLLKKGELVNNYPSHVTPDRYMISAELIGRLFTEFAQLADEVDILQELLSRHTEEPTDAESR